MDDSLAALTAEAIRFRDARDWAQFHRPKDLALGLSIEAGELGELLLWKTDAEIEAALAEPRFRERVGEELADVTLFLLYLAHTLDVPLAAAVRAKLAKNAAKYPVERFRGSARKYDEPDAS
jgi:NTP pyrophosphatase (non-canonical NTP hydrolase)